MKLKNALLTLALTSGFLLTACSSQGGEIVGPETTQEVDLMTDEEAAELETNPTFTLKPVVEQNGLEQREIVGESEDGSRYVHILQIDTEDDSVVYSYFDRLLLNEDDNTETSLKDVDADFTQLFSELDSSLVNNEDLDETLSNTEYPEEYQGDVDVYRMTSYFLLNQETEEEVINE